MTKSNHHSTPGQLQTFRETYHFCEGLLEEVFTGNVGWKTVHSLTVTFLNQPKNSIESMSQRSSSRYVEIKVKWGDKCNQLNYSQQNVFFMKYDQNIWKRFTIFKLINSDVKCKWQRRQMDSRTEKGQDIHVALTSRAASSVGRWAGSEVTISSRRDWNSSDTDMADIGEYFLPPAHRRVTPRPYKHVCQMINAYYQIIRTIFPVFFYFSITFQYGNHLN